MNRLISFVLGLVSPRHGGSRAGSASFLASIGAMLVGGGSWAVHHFNRSTQPRESGESAALPVYVPLAASFAGGFLIGRLLKKFIKTVALVAALVILAIGLAAHFGNDTTSVSKTVKQDTIWAKKEAKQAKDYVLGLLPSAGGGAAGVFMGGRKGKSGAAKA